jgi:hypothetical protein
MRGAFGKPLGTVARVDIGQPLISIRTYDKHKASVVEALRRSKFKFPGRQKVDSSKIVFPPLKNPTCACARSFALDRHWKNIFRLY